MYGENPIGKKVNLLEGYGFCSKRMTDEVCEVVAVKDYKESDDWCQHFIVKGADGTEKEIREVDCVFSPNDSEYEDSRIHHFLNDNGVYADVYTNHNGTSAVAVSIEWGDWKHEHLWARDLMSYLGYVEIGSRVTEEDGSDCYSAEHYFLKTA